MSQQPEWAQQMNTSLCDHAEDEGCWKCCQRCDLDMHSCYGCGEPLPHGTEVCQSCRKEIQDEARLNALRGN